MLAVVVLMLWAILAARPRLTSDEGGALKGTDLSAIADQSINGASDQGGATGTLITVPGSGTSSPEKGRAGQEPSMPPPEDTIADPGLPSFAEPPSSMDDASDTDEIPAQGPTSTSDQSDLGITSTSTSDGTSGPIVDISSEDGPSAGSVPVGGVSVSLPSSEPPATATSGAVSEQEPSSSDVGTGQDGSSMPPADVSSTEATSTLPLSSGDATSSSVDAEASSSALCGPPAPSIGADSIGAFNSSTLTVDLSWRPALCSSGSASAYEIFGLDVSNPSSSDAIATTTTTIYSRAVQDQDFGKNETFGIGTIDKAGEVSSLATTTISIPSWLSVVQPFDDADSEESWYSDNWYDLGSGFSGTIRSLSLEGYVDNSSYFDSILTLQEFSGPDYATLDHTYPISNAAPFTSVEAPVTFDDLKIPLHPEKYYRLTTYQTYQNRSVILRGTDATGTAMSDVYVNGIGKVSIQYAFYPYISAIIDPDEMTIAPPVLSGVVSTTFDAVRSQIDVSWPLAVNMDEPLVSSTYEVNVSTSTALDPQNWHPANGSSSDVIDAIFPGQYIIGVRALNDFGSASPPIIAHWSFPQDYTPVPEQLDATRSVAFGTISPEIDFLATTTASAIDFWIAPQSGPHCCNATSLSIYKDSDGQRGDELSSGNPVVLLSRFAAGGEESYPFASPIIFSPGSYWFVVGPSGETNVTTFYGSSAGVPYFRIEQVDPGSLASSPGGGDG